jgi:hypothetical protein
LRKEVYKVKEAIKEGKWAIIRNQKTIFKDRDQKYKNKWQFETLPILFWNPNLLSDQSFSDLEMLLLMIFKQRNLNNILLFLRSYKPILVS